MSPVRRSPLGRRGVVAIEFAVVLPFLIILVMATADILTALRSQMRLEATAVQIGQIVSQCTRIHNPGDVNEFWEHGQSIVGNLGTVTGTGAQGAIVITAVRRVSNANQVAWQLRTGSGAHDSTVANGGSVGARTPAAAGTAATLRGGFVVPDRETLIVTEVSLNRTALVLRQSVVGNSLPTQLRAATLFLSRMFDATPMQTPPTNNSNPFCTA